MLDTIRSAKPVSVTGSLARVTGHELRVRGLKLRVGDNLLVGSPKDGRPAEVVAVEPDGAIALVLGETDGLGKGDDVRHHRGFGVTLSDQLIGRVVDSLGRPLDGGPEIEGPSHRLTGTTPSPMERVRISEALPVGVKVLDSMVTAGRGQRIGIFGGSGVGKSTLLGMMARGTTADVVVLGLVGERGREVREFIEDELGEEGLQRAITVVSTSDQPPLMRLRAGHLATRIAEHYADQGKDVLLLLDSLTRLAMAQREVGLAAGEPPTARGYTPSVFSMMPALLERAGPRVRGTITAFYTVLVEGDDMNDPIGDAARSILDGHIVLDRRLAVEGRWPAIDPLSSLSRLADRILPPEHSQTAIAVRAALAAAEEVRDLVEVGAYVPGTNPRADRGLAAKDDLIAFFKQTPDDRTDFTDTWSELSALSDRLGL